MVRIKIHSNMRREIFVPEVRDIIYKAEGFGVYSSRGFEPYPLCGRDYADFIHGPKSEMYHG